MATLTMRVEEGDLEVGTFDEFQVEASGAGIAVDIETTGLSPQKDSIQVVSVASPNRIVVVPLQNGRHPILLCRLLENPTVLKIFHHATFDVSFLRHQWDLVIEPVFCTKVAARIGDVDRNPRLESLVSQLLKHSLDKSEQRSNWAVRPLSANQIHYAASDVTYLHDLKRELEWRINDIGRWTLFQACMRFINARAELTLLGLDDVFAYELSRDKDLVAIG